jgi:hydroxymethylpyrimidine/phosphomethylpyrimidine kinase
LSRLNWAFLGDTHNGTPRMRDQLISRHVRADTLPIVLIFAGNDPTDNTGHTRWPETYAYERLSHSYHGSGNALASACATALADGPDPLNAAPKGLEYTCNTLKYGFRPGMGHHLPERLYWARTQSDR